MRKHVVFLALLFTVVFPAPLLSAGDKDVVRTSREGTRLLPLPKGDDVWHFVIYGDRTGGPSEGIKVLEQAVSDTNLIDPDLVLTVGDLVQGYNITAEWIPQMREYQAVMGGLGMAWYPVPGNHDVYWRGPGRPEGGHEQNYEKHFGPLWYWFVHKNAAFFVLYSDEGDPETGRKGFSRPEHTQMSPTQINWLKGALKEVRALDHVFLFLHHPRWIERRYPGSNWNEVHKVLARAGNVTAVFAGHIHRLHYAGIRDGIEYFALATTGGGKELEFPEAGWLHHFHVVTVRKKRMSVAAVPVGRVLDPREITPKRRDELDKILAAARPAALSPIRIAAEGKAEGVYEFEMENPSSRPVEATIVADAYPGAWILRPGHSHRVIPPGGTARVSISYESIGSAIAGAACLPTLTAAVDYLAEGARITLPERSWTVQAELTSLPEGFFARSAKNKNGVLRLDGRTSCLRVESGRIALPDGPVTLEGWVNAETYKGRRPILAKSENSEYCIFAGDGVPEFSIHLNGRYATARAEGTSLVPGRWYHLAGVFDGEEIRIYVNGKCAAKVPASGKRTLNDFPFYVGADPNRIGEPIDCLSGSVDEVRISSKARYKAESFKPSRRLKPDKSTILLLHLDADLGPFAPDHSKSDAHALRMGRAACEAGS